jgi:hypothetical protein
MLRLAPLCAGGTIRFAAGLLAAFAALGASAAPMGFKGSTMAMADFSPDWREAGANRAFTARDAIGVGGLFMRSDDEARQRTLAEVTYTRLVERWNLAHAQANVWLFAGAGTMRGNDFPGARFAWTPGLQLDYETTRVYLAATARLYRAASLNHDFGSVRMGFSFYEADYDEVQPWFVLEARRMRQLSDKTEITPMLRVIHNRYFVEFGINNGRQARANLMVTF